MHSTKKLSSLYWLTYVLYYFVATSSYAQPKSPCIIYLKGSCSAGKSMLVESLKQRWQTVEIIDDDQLIFRAGCKAAAETFPLEYACIRKAINLENIYRAIFAKDVCYKKSATKEAQLKAHTALCTIQTNTDFVSLWKSYIEKIKSGMINTIHAALSARKTVLIDAWQLTLDQIQENFPHTPLIRVLLYCSLPVAFDRFEKRNKDALAQRNFMEKRFIGQLVSSFCSLYELQSQPSQPIEAVAKAELEEIFQLSPKAQS